MKRLTFTQFMNPIFVGKLSRYIAKDKINHIILGLIMNPLIYFFIFLFLGMNTKNSWIAFVLCLAYHLGIEAYQMISKTGKGEWLDALAGMSSAIVIIQPVILLILS